jgi:TolC family type I secretion outer membrane protein
MVSLFSLPAFAAQIDPFGDALRATYQNNPQILAERSRQQATDEAVPTALSGFRPTARYEYDRGRQRSTFGNARETYTDANSRTLRVEQPLFRGGRTISNYQAAKQRVRAGQARLSAVEQNVLFQSITAYMNVVQAEAILTLARNNEKVLQKQLLASQERFDVGEVTRTDVAQSEARLSSANADVISAEGQLISAVAVYERAIGSKPSNSLTTPRILPELPASLKEALAQALQQNPELLEALRSEKAAKYVVNSNIGSLLPEVSLVGSVSKQDNAGILGNTKLDRDSLTVNFSVPLYQSGAEYSRVREAKARQRQSVQQTVDARQAVEEQVTQAWEGLETALATINAREDQIKAAKVALDGVKQEQEYGARTVLDVLDAEQELFISKTNLVRAERNRIVAVYNLLLAQGNLTPQTLALNVPNYDPQDNYDDVKWLPAGF